ncbi:MAG: ABC transporter ATP-binding protein [Thermodesulfobacteriota bacterium]
MQLLRRLGAYFLPYWKHIAASLLCMAVVGATAGVTAWLVKPVLDDIFIRHDAWKLKILPVGLLALYLVKGGCRYLQSYLMRWVGENVVLRMRRDLLGSLQRRELAFYDRNPTGALIARVTNDVGLMQRAIPDLIQMLRQGFTVVGLLVVLFLRDWKLALVGVAVFPLAAYPVRRISTLMRRYARKGQERIGEISNVLQESFSGIEVVKTFRREGAQVRRFDEEAEKLRRVHLKSARVNEATAPLMEFLGAAGAALIIWYGGSQVLAGTTTPGSFFSFLTALFLLYDPLKRAGSLNNSFQQALAAGERVFGVMDEPPAPCELGGGRELGGPVEEVSFDGVRFAYEAGGPEVLQGVSLRAARGQVVALVGPSGGGKSTLLKLLPRFYDPTGGTVRINGVDLREYTLESLRGAVAVVTQDTFLFHDTVRRNLLVGRPDATDAEVEAAARAAHAHGFISALPQGYETPVGERGDLLSGGQKQRLAIARALLKDAPILVLDEATSALDSESEREVQAALEELMKRRTTFVIAHRLSTVRHADLILVVREGRVVEQGTHEALLARSGEYARLCAAQFRGEGGGDPDG